MNQSKSFILTLVVALAVTLSFSGVALAAQDGFAIVNVNKLFDEYEKTKEFDQNFQTEGRIKQEERDAIVHEIRRLRDEQALLAQDFKEDKQEAINAKLKELDAFDLGLKRELGEKRNAAVRDVFQDIENTIQKYGERKGFKYILNDRALLYREDNLDITEDVLKELNQKYKKNN